MLEVVAIQLENNKRQQDRIRKEFHRYSDLAVQAKDALMQLTKEQIHLRMWGCRNAKLQAKNTDSESTGGKGTQQGDD